MTSTAADARPVDAGRAPAWWRSAHLDLASRVLAVAAVAASAVAVSIVTRDGAWSLPAARDLPVDVAVGISFPLAVLLVLAGTGGRVMAALLLGIGLSAAGTAVSGAVLVTSTAAAGGAVAAAFLYSVLWVPSFVPLLTLLPLLYPDGRPPASRLRLAVPASAVGMVLLAVASATYPETYAGRAEVAKPWTSEALARPLFVAAAVLLVPAAAAGVVALVHRLRGSEGLVRRQVAVLLVAAAVLGVDTLLQGVLPWPVDVLSQCLAVALVPFAIGVAVTRHRLYDLDLALCRSVAGLSLAVCLAGVYLTVFGVVRATVDGQVWGAAVAAGVTGLLVQPLGARLNRGVDRLFYGDRATPAAVVGRVSSGLREGLDLAEIPGRVCRDLIDALRLGSAALVLGDDPEAPPIAEAGVPGPLAAGPAEQVPLVHRGRTVATLVVRPRPGEPRLTDTDLELLATVGDLVAPSIAALDLAARLRESRSDLVRAREEERLRLRRDLHDGVGAALAGLRLQVESARDLTPGGPAHQLLDSATRGVGTAIDDLRTVTDDLRPAGLDELGLAGGLQALVERVATPRVRIDARLDLPERLPPAVEVACYRIAAEALANVARHSGAGEASLSARVVDAGLELVVSDDGHGLPPEVRPGALGLRSIRQRAEEIGGSLEITSGPSGTTVRALLPGGTT